MSRVLTSWKEIAKYLGKGVRTVQRWETQNLGLPVRRPDKRKKGMIMAVAEELDEWIQTNSVRPLRKPAALEESERVQALLTAAEAEILELREQIERLQNLHLSVLAQRDR